MIGIKSPPRTGPIIPEIFICSPPSVFAEASSSLETISATTDEEAGEPNAKPRLKRNTLARMTYGLSKCISPRIIRQNAIEACHRFTAHKILLRSTMSARAPAGSVKRANGRAESVDISEIRKAESSRPTQDGKGRGVMRRDAGPGNDGGQPQFFKDRISQRQPDGGVACGSGHVRSGTVPKRRLLTSSPPVALHVV